jgi:hypothetical protein
VFLDARQEKSFAFECPLLWVYPTLLILIGTDNLALMCGGTHRPPDPPYLVDVSTSPPPLSR